MDNIGDPTSAVTPTSADAAFEQAMALHGENRLDEAERLYQAALSLDPGHAGALCYLGLLRLQQDRPEDSVTLLQQAIERDAGAAEAHHHLGVALERLGVYGQALACQDTALALIPDYGDACTTADRRCTRSAACRKRSPATRRHWPNRRTTRNSNSRWPPRSRHRAATRRRSCIAATRSGSIRP